MWRGEGRARLDLEHPSFSPPHFLFHSFCSFLLFQIYGLRGGGGSVTAVAGIPPGKEERLVHHQALRYLKQALLLEGSSLLPPSLSGHSLNK